jgi:putative membrane protein
MWWMEFSLDPGAVALIALVSALYARAVRTLRRRGHDVGRGQQAAWWGGVALTAAGLLGPIDSLAEDLLSAHMAQHLLIADLAAPLFLVGLRTPVLQNMLPPAAMRPLARARRLRKLGRTLRRPLVAIPVYVGVLYGWHLAFAFEAALNNGFVHVLQHDSFVAAGLIVWWPALEPDKARMRGELWKIGHIIGARFAGMFLGMAFLIMRSPAYEGFYGNRAAEHGLTPLSDQQLAGGMMLGLDGAIMIFALAFFFWRSAEDADRDEAASRPAARALSDPAPAAASPAEARPPGAGAPPRASGDRVA